MAILFLLSLLGRSGQGWTSALNHGLFSVLAVLTAVLTGAVLTPLLLPWLPGRAFSLKGLSMGLAADVIILFLCFNDLARWTGRLEISAWLLLIPALSAYLAMNFTGASTYTSLSGVRKEMRWALPLEIGAGIVGIALWLGSQFIA
jgi:acetyl-CoA decarbonylase/synthase complex subunit gamma